MLRLLLLPGLDGTGRLFTPLLRALPSNLSPQIVSYPLQPPLGYAELLSLVEAEAAESDDFVVVAESFSGPLALMLADRCPKNLRGVILCATFIRSPVTAPTLWRGLIQPSLFSFLPLGPISWALLGQHRHGELGSQLAEALRSVSNEAKAARIRSVARVNVTHELQTCPVPLLYIRATADRIVRLNSSRLIQSIRPDIQLIEIPAPHAILQTAPNPSAAAISTFCRQLTTSIK